MSVTLHAAAVSRLASGTTLQFGQLPAAVQTGLSGLATGNNLAVPVASQKVLLGNANGAETFTIRESGSGIIAFLTVDATGAVVTQPVSSTTTFGAIPSAAAVTAINNIATGLNLVAPTGSTNVSVSTPGSGPATFTVLLPRTRGRGNVSVVVDANGNPAGNMSLPFGALPTAIQTGLTTNTPTGAKALTATSPITVATQNGRTTFSARFAGAGANSIVAVDNLGALATLPSTSKVQFSTLPASSQTELQTLAAAGGFTGTIAARRAFRRSMRGLVRRSSACRCAASIPRQVCQRT